LQESESTLAEIAMATCNFGPFGMVLTVCISLCSSVKGRAGMVGK
jgi:hypothetical protein